MRLLHVYRNSPIEVSSHPPPFIVDIWISINSPSWVFPPFLCIPLLLSCVFPPPCLLSYSSCDFKFSPFNPCPSIVIHFQFFQFHFQFFRRITHLQRLLWHFGRDCSPLHSVHSYFRIIHHYPWSQQAHQSIRWLIIRLSLLSPWFRIIQKETNRRSSKTYQNFASGISKVAIVVNTPKWILYQADNCSCLVSGVVGPRNCLLCSQFISPQRLWSSFVFLRPILHLLCPIGAI